MKRFATGALSVGAALGMLLASISLASALGVGDKAPDFSLPASTSDDALKPVALSDLLAKKKNVVLFGFIGAWTPT